MLWMEGPSLVFGTNNIGANYENAFIGTNVVTSGSANTKGSDVNLLNGLAATSYGLWIMVAGEASFSGASRFMVDILIDAAAGVGGAGSSWTVLIANLYCYMPSFDDSATGCHYYFPLVLPRGAAIGARAQGSSGGDVLTVCVGTPSYSSRPEGAKYGQQVQTLGANTASTSGASITPGTSVKGAYTGSLGTLTFNSFAFQLGVGSADGSPSTRGYLFDLAAGSLQDKICVQDMPFSVTQETGIAFGCTKWVGIHALQRLVPVGSSVYARGAACGGSPDSSMTVVAYAVS